MMMVYFFRLCLILCLHLLLSLPLLSKHPAAILAGDPNSADLEAYAVNKVVPDEMREVILTALSFFPELKDTRIAFVFKDNIRNSVMQAQPELGSIFRKKSSRSYVIKISKYLKLNHTNVAIEMLPFDVLVGWIGHELGHIMDYKERGSLAMIGFGIRYVLFKNFVLGAEKTADLYALKHGLGESIMETKNFVLNHDDIPAVYKARIKRLYMSPEDFMRLLGEAEP